MIGLLLMTACTSKKNSVSVIKKPTTTTSSAKNDTTHIPKEFVEFAKAIKKNWSPDPVKVWYPSYLPNGFKFKTLETTTIAEGMGPVCDVVFANGKSEIWLSQGSAVCRDYEIVPIETIPWGTDTADTMDAEVENDSKKVFIVYAGFQNLGELSGGVSNQELKKIAASMKEVP
jgi:hypothetical protein